MFRLTSLFVIEIIKTIAYKTCEMRIMSLVENKEAVKTQEEVKI